MGRLNKTQFEYILNKHNTRYKKIDTFIETGTWRGEQLNLASPAFSQIFGIELSTECYNETVKNTKQNNNIQIIHGDTKTELPVLLNEFSSTPVVIYLDAHYCVIHPPIKKSTFPLWSELELIKKRNCNDIILIDDVHNFGKERNDLKQNIEDKEWESVTLQSILNFFNGKVYDNEIIDDALVIWR